MYCPGRAVGAEARPASDTGSTVEGVPLLGCMAHYRRQAQSVAVPVGLPPEPSGHCPCGDSSPRRGSSAQCCRSWRPLRLARQSLIDSQSSPTSSRCSVSQHREPNLDWTNLSNAIKSRRRGSGTIGSNKGAHMKKFLVILSVMAVAVFMSGIASAQEKAPGTVILKGVADGRREVRPRQALEDGRCEVRDLPPPVEAREGVKTAHQACQDCHTKAATAPMKTTTQGAFHKAMAKSGVCIDCHVKAVAAGKTAPAASARSATRRRTSSCAGPGSRRALTALAAVPPSGSHPRRFSSGLPQRSMSVTSPSPPSRLSTVSP